VNSVVDSRYAASQAEESKEGGALLCMDLLADEELKVLSMLLASVWVNMIWALRID
jgi:hypothetical protein